MGQCVRCDDEAFRCRRRAAAIVALGQVGGRWLRRRYGQCGSMPSFRHDPHAAADLAHAVPRLLRLRHADRAQRDRLGALQGVPATVLQPSRLQVRHLHDFCQVSHGASALPGAFACSACERRDRRRAKRVPGHARGARTQ